MFVANFVIYMSVSQLYKKMACYQLAYR